MSMVMIDEAKFEHLLNCMANQKYIHEQSPEVQKEWQEIMDAAWDDGMKELSNHRFSKTLRNAPRWLSEMSFTAKVTYAGKLPKRVRHDEKEGERIDWMEKV